MKNYIIHNQKGFTIIETLVAITILMISIAGPLTIAQKSLMAAIYAKDQVTASFLAQQKIEEIKNRRDTYFLVNGNDTQFDNWIRSEQTDHCDPNLTTCGAITFGATITDTQVDKFTITHSVAKTNPGVESTVTVTVTWRNGTVVNNITLKDHLFNVVL